jgi:hypothetical protein
MERSEAVDQAAVDILRVLKPLSKEDRLDALAMACHVFCVTEMTLELRAQDRTYR